jgi:hypothetical protein
VVVVVVLVVVFRLMDLLALGGPWVVCTCSVTLDPVMPVGALHLVLALVVRGVVALQRPWRRRGVPAPCPLPRRHLAVQAWGRPPASLPTPRRRPTGCDGRARVVEWGGGRGAGGGGGAWVPWGAAWPTAAAPTSAHTAAAARRAPTVQAAVVPRRPLHPWVQGQGGHDGTPIHRHLAVGRTLPGAASGRGPLGGEA